MSVRRGVATSLKSEGSIIAFECLPNFTSYLMFLTNDR